MVMLIITFIVHMEGVLHCECMEGLLSVQNPRAPWLLRVPSQ